ncbi:hypothetical protein JHK85_017169 [Glycine max]|nr:hypothetical protein JHK85_017169 [Glycine max]
MEERERDWTAMNSWEERKGWVSSTQRHYWKVANKEEWEIRFVIYQANVEYIGCKKSQKNSYNLTDNKFADLTNEEFGEMGNVINEYL